MTYSNAGRWLALSGLLLINTVASPVHAQPDADPAVPTIQIAAADTQDIETGTTGQLDTVDSYRLALLKLKGHLGVARTLLQLRAPGTEYHLQQPVQKIFSDIEPELEGRSAPLTSDVLAQLERATEAAPDAALATLDSVASAIDGSFAQPGAVDPASALALSEALLREAVDLYAESVADNEVIDIQGYQTGRGFAIQAEALVRHSTGLREMSAHDALLAAVVLIRQAWPGVIPPPIVFDPQSVAGRLEETVAMMEDLK